MRTAPFLITILFLIQCSANTYRQPIRRQGLAKNKDLKVIHGWKMVEFAFPSISVRQSMLKSGAFIPENVIILDVDYWQNGKKEKVFTTLPKMKEGVPVSLATVSTQKVNGAPLLSPFPDWSWHREDNCEGIMSAFRMQVDQCNRLWIIDSGVTNILEDPQQTCPPKILAFDLNSNVLTYKYLIPETVFSKGSLLVTIAVDVRNNHCSNAFVYIADVTNYGLIVLDAVNRHSWRVNSNFFYPYPTHGDFDVAGHKFDLMDGVIGLALSPIDIYGDRTLYFHSLASVRESKVAASLLRNASNFENGNNHVSKKFYVTDEVRSSQSATEAMSQDGVLFFGLLTDLSLACWNSRLPYIPANIAEVVKNPKTLEFPSGLKIVKRNGVEEVWAMTSKFPAYYAGVLDKKEINYRIVTGVVKELIRGTVCEPL